jgi:hypothetical protein
MLIMSLHGERLAPMHLSIPGFKLYAARAIRSKRALNNGEFFAITPKRGRLITNRAIGPA